MATRALAGRAGSIQVRFTPASAPSCVVTPRRGRHRRTCFPGLAPGPDSLPQPRNCMRELSGQPRVLERSRALFTHQATWVRRELRLFEKSEGVHSSWHTMPVASRSHVPYFQSGPPTVTVGTPIPFEASRMRGRKETPMQHESPPGVRAAIARECDAARTLRVATLRPAWMAGGNGSRGGSRSAAGALAHSPDGPGTGRRERGAQLPVHREHRERCSAQPNPTTPKGCRKP